MSQSQVVVEGQSNRNGKCIYLNIYRSFLTYWRHNFSLSSQLNWMQRNIMSLEHERKYGYDVQVIWIVYRSLHGDFVEELPPQKRKTIDPVLPPKDKRTEIAAKADTATDIEEDKNSKLSREREKKRRSSHWDRFSTAITAFVLWNWTLHFSEMSNFCWAFVRYLWCNLKRHSFPMSQCPNG